MILQPVVEGVNVPIQDLAWFLIAFIAGFFVPRDYAIERFRGFARFILSQLPYKGGEK